MKALEILYFVLLLSFLQASEQVIENDRNLISSLDDSESANNNKILYLADVHIDLLYDSYSSKDSYQCKKILPDSQELIFDRNITLNKNDFGKYGCDTNKNLFIVLLQKAKSLFSKYKFIIILGDTITHYLNKDTKNMNTNYKEAFEFMSSHIKQEFPDSSVLFAIGNNDFTTRYEFAEVEEYNRQLLELENYFIKINGNEKSSLMTESSNKNITDEYLKSWYSVFLDKHIKGVFINSLLFNTQQNNILIEKKGKDSKEYKALISLVNKQFEFLENELILAGKNNYKVIINEHIPTQPSYIYDKISIENDLWIKNFSARFDDLAYKYSNVILMVFSAHYHYGSISLRRKEYNKDFGLNKQHLRKPKTYKDSNYLYYMPGIHIPSMSLSNYNAQPGFSVVSLNNGEISEIENTYLNISIDYPENYEFSDLKFNVFNFKSALHINKLDAENLNKIVTNENNYTKFSYYTSDFIENMDDLKKHYKLETEKAIKLNKCASLIISNEDINIICDSLNDEIVK